MIKIATNPAAKKPNCKRVTVGAATEVPFSFDGVVSIIGFQVQAYQAVNLLMSFEAGGTASPDNYFTVKSGTVYIERDINWTPDEDALFFLSASGEITVEVIYWG